MFQRCIRRSSRRNNYRIAERGTTKVVGTFQDNKGFGFVIPDDKKIPMDIFIAKGDTLGAIDGHKVVVEITEWPE